MDFYKSIASWSSVILLTKDPASCSHGQSLDMHIVAQSRSYLHTTIAE